MTKNLHKKILFIAFNFGSKMVRLNFRWTLTYMNQYEKTNILYYNKNILNRKNNNKHEAIYKVLIQ